MDTERYFCSICGIKISSTRQVCGKYVCDNEKNIIVNAKEKFLQQDKHAVNTFAKNENKK